jgi:hypothetical protein
MKMTAKIGDERFVLETISQFNWETLARTRGWDGGDDLRSYCDPEDVAQHYEFKTLKEAETKAKEFLATGRAAYGCCLIDRQVYEAAHDDRGRRVKMPPSWETHQTYEIAMDGETITVGR